MIFLTIAVVLVVFYFTFFHGGTAHAADGPAGGNGYQAPGGSPMSHVQGSMISATGSSVLNSDTASGMPSADPSGHEPYDGGQPGAVYVKPFSKGEKKILGGIADTLQDGISHAVSASKKSSTGTTVNTTGSLPDAAILAPGQDPNIGIMGTRTGIKAISSMLSGAMKSAVASAQAATPTPSPKPSSSWLGSSNSRLGN